MALIQFLFELSYYIGFISFIFVQFTTRKFNFILIEFMKHGPSYKIDIDITTVNVQKKKTETLAVFAVVHLWENVLGLNQIAVVMVLCCDPRSGFTQ